MCQEAWNCLPWSPTQTMSQYLRYLGSSPCGFIAHWGCICAKKWRTTWTYPDPSHAGSLWQRHSSASGVPERDRTRNTQHLPQLAAAPVPSHVGGSCWRISEAELHVHDIDVPYGNWSFSCYVSQGMTSSTESSSKTPIGCLGSWNWEWALYISLIFYLWAKRPFQNLFCIVFFYVIWINAKQLPVFLLQNVLTSLDLIKK